MSGSTTIVGRLGLGGRGGERGWLGSRRARVARRRRSIPFVPQMAANECLVACLTMVLRSHGHRVDLHQVREALHADRDGASAAALIEAAARFGLRGRGLRVEPSQLERLAPGTILHWEAKHFVVLLRARAGRATILDPAHGRRHVEGEALARGVTGLAVELLPDPEAVVVARPVPGPSPTWSLVRRVATRPGPALAYGLASIALVGLGVLVPWLMERLFVRAMAGAGSLWPLGSAIAALWLATVGLRYGREQTLSKIGIALEDALSRATVGHLLRLPWSFFARRTRDDLVQRLTGLGDLRRSLVAVGGVMTTEAVMVPVYLGVLIAWMWPMALAAVGLAVLQSTTTLVLGGRQQPDRIAELAATAQAQRFGAQMLEEIRAVKTGGLESAMQARWSSLHAAVGPRQRAVGRGAAIVTGLQEGFGVLAALALMAVGVAEVLAGRASIPAMAGANCLAVSCLRPLVAVICTVPRLGPMRTEVARIDDVLRSRPEHAAREREGLEPSRSGSSRTADSPSTHARGPGSIGGTLELDEVTLAHRPGGPAVLHDVSLSVAPGEHLAIVGRSGSGKSSLVAALVGLVPVTAGRVRVDGVALEDLDPMALRRRIAVVDAHAALFDGTIHDNIALGDPRADLAAVQAAARCVGLHDEVLAMPMGYATGVYDGGKGLSDGQRQRIALARAIVGQPRILVLDEATAGFDVSAERALVEAIGRGSRATILTVTRRRAVVERADRVAVLDQGTLVQLGPAAEVLRGEPARSLLDQVDAAPSSCARKSTAEPEAGGPVPAQ